MPEAVMILVKQRLIGASPCFESFRSGKPFQLSDFSEQIGERHVEKGILMVFTGSQTCFFLWALILIGILLFGLVPSWVSSGLSGFFEENVLLSSHLDFLGSLG